MLTLRRGFVAGLVTFAASAAIAACSGSRSRGDTQPSARFLLLETGIPSLKMLKYPLSPQQPILPKNSLEAGGTSFLSLQPMLLYGSMLPSIPMLRPHILRNIRQ